MSSKLSIDADRNSTDDLTGIKLEREMANIKPELKQDIHIEYN